MCTPEKNLTDDEINHSYDHHDQYEQEWKEVLHADEWLRDARKVTHGSLLI
jgi:hypothetical protein